MPASAATASMVSRAAPSRLTTVSAAVRTASLSMILRRPIGHPISNQTVGYISLGLAAVKQRYAGALRKLANDQRASVFCKGNSSGTATPPFRFLRRSAIRRDLRVWTADPKKASCNRLAEVGGMPCAVHPSDHITGSSRPFLSCRPDVPTDLSTRSRNGARRPHASGHGSLGGFAFGDVRYWRWLRHNTAIDLLGCPAARCRRHRC